MTSSNVLTSTKISVNVVIFSLASLILLVSVVYAATNNLINMRFTEHVVLGLILLVVTFSRRSPKHLQAITGSGALLIGSTILVTLTNGSYAAQLVFPVTLVVITFYKDYFAYFLGVLYVIIFYYLTTFLDPLLLYEPTILALGIPYSWAVSVVVFSILASGLGILFWRLNDKSFLVREKLAVALAESSLKQRQALDIHDNIVQGLTVAKYALDLQEYTEASKAVNSTLDSAKKLIGSLSADLHKVDPFLRYESSEEIFTSRNENTVTFIETQKPDTANPQSILVENELFETQRVGTENTINNDPENFTESRKNDTVVNENEDTETEGSKN